MSIQYYYSKQDKVELNLFLSNQMISGKCFIDYNSQNESIFNICEAMGGISMLLQEKAFHQPQDL